MANVLGRPGEKASSRLGLIQPEAIYYKTTGRRECLVEDGHKHHQTDLRQSNSEFRPGNDHYGLIKVKYY